MVIVHGGIDAEVPLGVGVEQSERGIFFVEPSERKGRAEIPCVRVEELDEFGHGLGYGAIASWRG